MAYELCDKIKNLTPYEPNETHYRIRLDANESYFSLPDFLREKICDALTNTDLNRYPDPLAKDLTEAFGKRYGVSPKLVTAGNGSDELISIITSTFLEKGERLLTFATDFSMYQFYGSLYEAKTVTLEKKDLHIDVDEAIAYIQKNNIRMVIFSNPCNPTSIGLSKEETKRLIASVDALMVLDEAYMDFWDRKESLLDEVDQFDNLIILRTCSKAVGAAALRLGFAVANPTITNALRAVKSPYNVNTISQIMGSCILNEGEYLNACEDAIKESVRTLYQMVKPLEGKVLQKIHLGVTNFLFIKTDKAKEIFKALLQESISIRCFDGYLRITAGTKEENEALTEALSNIVRKMEEIYA